MSTENATYVCTGEAPPSCPFECVSLANCEECRCAVQDTGGGAWGNAMDVIMCLLPIVFLLVATLPPCGLKALDTTVSLPLSAFLMWCVRLMYLGSDPLLVSGTVVKGIHEAITPLTIMMGAITLFETMEVTNCMPYMMREMKALTKGHSIAELLIVFCFAYMVEGASGFGTPAALGAPMLISLGHPKYECVVTLLLMNTFATVWGAVGTPIWFGFGSLGLSDADFLSISYNSGIALAVSAFLLVPFVFTFVAPLAWVRANWIFFFLGLGGCILPSMGLSFVSFEFPSLLGGIIGFAITTVLIKLKVGLKPMEVGHSLVKDANPMEISSVMESGIVGQSVKSTAAAPSLKSLKEGSVEPASTELEDTMKASGKTSTSKSLAHGDFDEKHAELDKDDERSEGSSAYESAEEADPETAAKGGSNGGYDGSTPIVDEEAPPPPHEEAPMKNEEQALKGGGGGGERKLRGADDVNVASNSVNESLQRYQEDGDFSAVEAATQSLQTVRDVLGPRKSGWPYYRETILRTMPIWLTVLLLILTRIPQIGIKQQLQRREPYFEINLESYGTFRLSASLVFQLYDILTYPNLNWAYEALYIPFLVPFVLVSLITLFVYRKETRKGVRGISAVVINRVKKPAVALAGALTLVQLMITGGDASPASIIGITLSDALKAGWIAFAASIGALGSFFSGSTTVSNLTFGGIQQIAAERTGLSVTAMLALQACGASAGNGICLNNIISVCTVVGLDIGEGQVIGKTCKVVGGIIVVATLIMLAFLGV